MYDDELKDKYETMAESYNNVVVTLEGLNIDAGFVINFMTSYSEYISYRMKREAIKAITKIEV